jgi:hypothetical protein
VSITNYSELKTAVADWLNRDDISEARITDFIQIAESRIFHELRIPPMEKYATITTDSEGRVALPGDFLEAKDVIFNDKALERMTVTDYYSREAAQGTPYYFTRETIYLRLWPVPGPGVTGLKMIYYYEPEDLSDTNPTNPVFSMAPELYLYGALVAAGTYLGSPVEKITLWSQSFNDTMSRLMNHAKVAETAGATPTVASGY